MTYESLEHQKDLSIGLKIEQLKHNLDKAISFVKEFETVAKGSDELRQFVINEVAKYALSIRSSKLDKDELNNFFKYPYCILPGKHEGECYLAIPKFIDAHFGWLSKVTPSYNIFLVNQYVDWLGELPAALKKEMKFPDPLDVHLDGNYLVGSDTEKVLQKYSKFLTKQKDGRLLIDKTRHFEMLAGLIKDGILPFIPKPVNKEDLINRKCDIELRDYQLEAWKEFLKYSNIGAFFPPSTGKTWLGMWALSHVKGPAVVAVPSRILIEQWMERIELYTDLKVTNDMKIEGYEVYVGTYQSVIKSKRHYKLKIIDEVHHLPANEFSKLATIESEYCIGLSATPQREDEREEYIFALTGRPVGLAWETFKQLGIIQNPPMHVWIVKNEVSRIKQLEQLLQTQQKTIIFCDSIEMGKMVAKRFDLPHIHGTSKERLSSIKDALVSVVSRVGDEGVSLSDIERVIEISWLHGSRRQELQRFTRLLHGRETKGEAHIIMTGQEYQADHKRLFGLMDKGFKIILHREGEKETHFTGYTKDTHTIREPKRNYSATKKTLISIKKEEKIAPNDFEMSHSILSLPGIQKKLSTLKRAERLCVRIFYEQPDKIYTKEDIWNKVGIGRVMDFANFGKLIELKLIKKVPKGYQAA